MRSADEIEKELVSPGGAFEIVREDVLGESMAVFKNRDRTRARARTRTRAHTPRTQTAR